MSVKTLNTRMPPRPQVGLNLLVQPKSAMPKDFEPLKPRRDNSPFISGIPHLSKATIFAREFLNEKKRLEMLDLFREKNRQLLQTAVGYSNPQTAFHSVAVRPTNTPGTSEPNDLHDHPPPSSRPPRGPRGHDASTSSDDMVYLDPSSKSIKTTNSAAIQTLGVQMTSQGTGEDAPHRPRNAEVQTDPMMPSTDPRLQTIINNQYVQQVQNFNNETLNQLNQQTNHAYHSQTQINNQLNAVILQQPRDGYGDVQEMDVEEEGGQFPGPGNVVHPNIIIPQRPAIGPDPYSATSPTPSGYTPPLSISPRRTPPGLVSPELDDVQHSPESRDALQRLSTESLRRKVQGSRSELQSIRNKAQATRSQVQAAKNQLIVKRDAAMASRSKTQEARNKAQASRSEDQRLRNLAKSSQSEAQRLRNLAEASRSEEQRLRNVAQASRSDVQKAKNQVTSTQSDEQRLRNLAQASRSELQGLRNKAQASRKKK
jgi:hypothetical protein